MHACMQSNGASMHCVNLAIFGVTRMNYYKHNINVTAGVIVAVTQNK